MAGGSALPGRRIGTRRAGKVDLIRSGEDTVIVHKGDPRRQAGLEVGQSAAQDAISQRRAGQLGGEDSPLINEAAAAEPD
jgi:hypothetical protein